MSTRSIRSSLKLSVIAGAVLLLSAASAQAGQRGGDNCVPEIDPSIAGSTISAVLGGLALLSDRRRRSS